MSVEIGDLAAQIAERRDRLATLDDGNPNQDATIALIVLLEDALAAEDLTRDELDRAIALAEAGRLLRSSGPLAERLAAYRESRFAAV